ncbi:epithelial chloride channel protein-like [Mizuhopecten yessoensis]|uniref:Epithelial chloride channel protein n=1 Tax=Mizuhopecten yessoensis TaxID=6573 RepID=A0A210R0Z9_MIZYE|nr:epithelial chloride channel protein-like [Mizuhopecten yessoensis]OWF54545.1 Epithelial chloride channel protein [Mizuhopecten yessoensis]
MSTYSLLGLLLFYLVGIDKLAAISRQSEIKLENNGYSDILLAFDETIPHSQVFINKTMDYFTRASKVLYIATRQRAYFKDIRILVPHTWPDDPSYQSASADQTVYKSDVIITSSSVKKRSIPQTRTYGGCGSQGIHIQFTTDFLFKERYPPYYSRSDKFIVHQWATFRWGVFQEYPSAGERTFYFSTAFAKVDAVKCSFLLKGRVYARDDQHNLVACQTDPSTGLYTESCQYYAYPRYPSGVQTHVSLMDHQYIQEITGFCDDDADYATKHNAEPLNRQNRLCSHRSTWDVISNSPDFAGGRNPPTNYTDAELVPTFTFIKAARKRRSVILMDTGHITQHDASRLKLSQAVAHFLGASQGQRDHEILLSGGLENALRAKRLARSERETEDSPKVIRDMGYGLSNIDHDGVKQLFSPESTPSQKQVIVFSTNQTNHPNTEAFKSAGVTLHWISLHPHPGTHKDAGTPVYYSHRYPESMTHVDAVYDVIQRTQGTDAYTVKLFSVTKSIQFGQDYRDTFSVDTSLHGDLSLTVTYTGEQPFLEVTSPSSKHYNEDSPETEINPELKMMKLKLKYDDAEVGKWEFRMKGRHSTSTVSLVVSSNSTAKNSVPIILKARLFLNKDLVPPKMAAYADVTQGQHSVTGLQVIATVFRPGVEDGEHAKPYKMLLFDEGSGADIIKDDGIYSRYFPHLTGRGDYQLTVDIINSHGTVVTHRTGSGDKPDRNNTYSISRSAHGGSVYLPTDQTGDKAWPTTPATSGGNDVYPPSRIIDLHVVQKSDINMTVSLSWTAPGDDLDHGTAAKYDIKYEQSSLDLLKLKADSHSVPDFAIVTGSTTKPLPAGTSEYLTINVTDLFLIKHEGFAFLIRGIDDFGNKGEFSNMVTVGFSVIPETLRTRHDTGSNVDVDNSDSVGYMVDPKVDAPRSKSGLRPLLFLNVILLVCFLLIAASFVSIYFRNRFSQPKVLIY